ncbi:MAG: lysine exporter LysO family protein [Solirubrobacterales bacterium]
MTLLLLPLIALLVGALMEKLLRPAASFLMQYSLYLLLVGIGARIGSDRALLASIPHLGIKAALLCLFASTGSAVFVLIWEKLFVHAPRRYEEPEDEEVRFAYRREYFFIIYVLLFLLIGTAAGYFLRPSSLWVSRVIDAALIVIFVSVGVGLREGLSSLKTKRAKTGYLWIPIVILSGSLAGGLLGGLIGILPIPTAVSVGGGMGYYSVTTALVNAKSGTEAGFIAFLANFMREVLTFLLTPFLARISGLLPVALGGATAMDTTLAVIRRCAGEDYALLGFLSGVILTIITPFLLAFLLSL